MGNRKRFIDYLQKLNTFFSKYNKGVELKENNITLKKFIEKLLNVDDNNIFNPRHKVVYKEMIDQIKNTISKADFNGSSSNSKKASLDSAKVNVQNINSAKSIEKNVEKVTQFISKERIKDMAKQPPIDKASTTRIKNANANGSYPIDLDKIADALYDAYKELKD